MLLWVDRVKLTNADNRAHAERRWVILGKEALHAQMKKKKKKAKADKSLHTSFHSHIESVKRISKNHLPHALKSNFKKKLSYFLSHSRILQVWELKSDSGTQQMGWISLSTSNRNDSFLKWRLSVVTFFSKLKKCILTMPVWDESVLPQDRELTAGVRDELWNVTANLKVSLRSL